MLHTLLAWPSIRAFIKLTCVEEDIVIKELKQQVLGGATGKVKRWEP